MAAGVVAVAATGAEGGRAAPVEAIGFQQAGLQLQQTLQGAKAEVAAGCLKLHKPGAAVAQGAGDGGLIADGPGVGGRDHLVAQFRITVAVQLQKPESRIAPGQEIVLQQGADATPFATAHIAVVPEAEITPQRSRSCGFHTQADRGLGGVTAQAPHVAFDIAHTTTAHLHQGLLHGGQVQHSADQGLQLLFHPGLEFLVAAGDPEFSDAAEDDIECAWAGIGEGVDPGVDVSVLDQPGCE